MQEQHEHLLKEKDELEAKLNIEMEKASEFEEKIMDFMESKSDYLDKIKEVGSTCAL